MRTRPNTPVEIRVATKKIYGPQMKIFSKHALESAVGNSSPFLTNLPFHDFPNYMLPIVANKKVALSRLGRNAYEKRN
jgi:hypothetical protein